MDQILTSDVLNNIKADTLKFGLAETGARVGATRGISWAALTDAAWLTNTLLVLLGFAVYQIVVRRLVPTASFSGSSRMALDDILKVGTMLVFKQVASTRSWMSIADRSWQMTSLGVVGGFVAYDFVTRHALNMVVNTAAMSGPLRQSVEDVAKFGTMFVVSNFVTGGAFDADWAMVSGSYIAGLVAYNYLISKF